MRHFKEILLTAITCAAILLLLVLALCVSTYAYTDYQEALHEAAEFCRNDLGLPEDSEAIQTIQALWQKAEWEVEIITTVVYNEGNVCSQRHKELIAQVVCNRVRSGRFPNSVEEVVKQTGQYLPAYTNPEHWTWKRARQNAEHYAACRAAAEAALNGEVDCPDNVLWQANFPQGDGVYEEIEVDTGWFRSTTYFCYTEEN